MLRGRGVTQLLVPTNGAGAPKTAGITVMPASGWEQSWLATSNKIPVEGSKWPDCEGVTEKPGFTDAHPIVLICHVLTGGPCAIIKGNPGMTYLDLHNQCLTRNKAVVVKGDANYEDGYPGPFLLCALRSSSTPIFAAYPISSKVALLVMVKVLHFKRLPIVFDLDETCIMACSTSKFVRSRKGFEHMLQRAPAGSLEARKLKKLIQILEGDHRILREFIETDAVNGKESVVDLAHNQFGNVVKRPTVKVTDDVICTRIDPDSTLTSMLFRIRPKWFTILKDILGENPDGKQNLFDVRVCTAGERDYALEVWRILDPGPQYLISPPARARNIVAGQRSKELRTLFNLDDSVPPSQSAFPLAIIIDDRLDVWCNKSEQQQVLQVAPYEPWEEQANAELEIHDQLTVQRIAEQMIRLKDELLAIRTKVMEGIDDLRSKYNSTFGSGLSLDMSGDPFSHYQRLLPTLPSIHSMLEPWREREGENLRPPPTEAEMASYDGERASSIIQAPGSAQDTSFSSLLPMMQDLSALAHDIQAAIPSFSVPSHIPSQQMGSAPAAAPFDPRLAPHGKQPPLTGIPPAVQRMIPGAIGQNIGSAAAPKDPRKRAREEADAAGPPSRAPQAPGAKTSYAPHQTGKTGAEEEVSADLWIGNLKNDATTEDVAQVMLSVGCQGLNKTQKIHNKRFAFLAFDSVKNALLARESIEGKVFPTITMEQPLIVQFSHKKRM